MINFLLERDLVPDPVIRTGIRHLLERRRHEESAPSALAQRERHARFVAELQTMPIAINTSDSRVQHYEVPTEFYQCVLGPRLKYSCCWFETGSETLAAAEEAMLSLYVERAQLSDGQQILELGCGWGSLSLFLAERFPQARITGVSHSRTQKAYIDAECRRRGLGNVTIVSADMNDYAPPTGRFDRVVSVEMFEHMKNWPRLLTRIADALTPGGLFFLHIFTHRRFAYHFVARDDTDWMSRYFFTGGMMPSEELIVHFQEDLRLRTQWRINGRHYQRTAQHWLANMDANRAALRPIFEATYGREHRKWWGYWRVFFMACAELWGYADGEEWNVNHYLLERPAR